MPTEEKEVGVVACPTCGTEIAADQGAEKCYQCGADMAGAEVKESEPVEAGEDDSLPVNEKLPEVEAEQPEDEAPEEPQGDGLTPEAEERSAPAEDQSGEVTSDPVSE